MSKGSRVRPHNKQKFDENYARVFGPKKFNVWTEKQPQCPAKLCKYYQTLPGGCSHCGREESCPGCGGSGYLEGLNKCPCQEEDFGGIQRNSGNGMRDWSDGGRIADVSQEPRGALDSQAAGPVASPPLRNGRAALDLHPLDTAYWIYSGYRGEFTCPHGVGHGNHVHGCCEEQCCQRDDFPLRKDKG